MQRRAWTRSELLKVLSLYTQLPFGQMHMRNPVVVNLSHIIDRSPSAIALKLVNFASLDPELKKRGINGMSNYSRGDRELWNEFNGRWQELANAYTFKAESIGLRVKDESIHPRKSSIDSTEISRIVKSRLGQQYFRNAVLAAYDRKCCITQIRIPELLRASHIIPWADKIECRLDPRNGLCLNTLHDAAFDEGLIAIGKENRLLIASRIKNEMPSDLYQSVFGQYEGMPIRLPERFHPDVNCLEYHRDKIFNRVNKNEKRIVKLLSSQN